MPAPDANATLPEWLAYLESLHHTEIDLGLDRVRQVAAALQLDYPYRIITVGGTNGKGSVCAMLEAILQAAGYKTGTYTSPHLVDYNERIRISGDMASDSQITEQFRRIEAARGDVSLTYFEFSTLAALLLFREAGIEVAILEVGLGGRLDAVNIADSDCAIITSIDVDHSAYLGSDRESIAREKAHIFRPGKPAICADPQPPQTLVDHAKQIGADLWLFGKDFNYSGDALQWGYGGRHQRRAALAYPSLRGANQLLNASAVLAALEALRNQLVVPAHALRLGFLHAALPGRFQILPGQPAVILDVAHNPHAAAALAQNLIHMPCAGQTWAVVGMFSDKDTGGVLEHMIDHVDHWLCADLDTGRALGARDLAAQIQNAVARRTADRDTRSGLSPLGELTEKDTEGGAVADSATQRPGVRPSDRHQKPKSQVTVQCLGDPVAAFNLAQKNATPNDRILVFGSFATVGPVLKEVSRKGS